MDLSVLRGQSAQAERWGRVISLYGDYIVERTDDKIIESPSGFATYRYLGTGTVYIVDIFVPKSERKKGVASGLADLICAEAKEKGCTEVIGTVVPGLKGSTGSLKALLAYGFELSRIEMNAIVLRKDL